MNDNDKFHYTYSAPTEEERKEIKRLRSQYLPAPQEGALARLKQLDKKARTIPTAILLTLGVVGTLIFGLGQGVPRVLRARISGQEAYEQHLW